MRVWRGSEKNGSPELLTSHRRVGEGIVPLVDGWFQLLDWAKTGARSGIPTLMLFDSSGLGRFADDARRAGVYVVGGGTFADKTEKDRGYGANIAEAAGMKAPKVREFKSVDDTLAFARSGKLTHPVYWKTDAYIDADATHCAETADELVEYLSWIKTRTRSGIYNVLEEKKDGIALSTARWWNGRAWVGPYEWTLEHKKFMAGDVGPGTGCSLNAVGFYEDEAPEIAAALKWDALTPLFLKHDAPPGLYDVNAIVSDGEAFFLEWTNRFGYDSEGTSLTQLYGQLCEWLWYVGTGQGDGGALYEDGELAVGIRLSVPPYPWEHGERDEKGSCVGVPVNGETGNLWSDGFVAYQVAYEEAAGLSVAAPEGLVGLSAARGESLSELADETLEFAKKGLRIPGCQFRNDAGAVLADDAREVWEAGFPLTPGLLR